MTVCCCWYSPCLYGIYHCVCPRFVSHTVSSQYRCFPCHVKVSSIVSVGHSLCLFPLTKQNVCSIERWGHSLCLFPLTKQNCSIECWGHSLCLFPLTKHNIVCSVEMLGSFCLFPLTNHNVCSIECWDNSPCSF